MSDFAMGETPREGSPRLMQQVHEAIRRLHYSRRTEEAYAHWIRHFIHWSGKRHPATLGATEVTAFLSHLATERNVAAATQNQALAALLFLYKQVLGMELGWFDDLVRAKRPVRLPVVLTQGEVKALLAQLKGPFSRCTSSLGRRSACTRSTFAKGMGKCICRLRSRASTHAQDLNGVGNTSSPPPGARQIRRTT